MTMQRTVPVELVEFTWAASSAVFGTAWMLAADSKAVTVFMLMLLSANFSMLFWRTYDRLSAPPEQRCSTTGALAAPRGRT